MKVLLPAAAAIALLGLAGCSTTDAVSLPFDLASTTGDSATSTSSTSDGDDNNNTTAQLEQQRYVRTQINWIRSDAARGEGESLAALAQLLGEPDQAEFASWSQQNYDQLFANLEQPEQLLQRIENLRN